MNKRLRGSRRGLTKKVTSINFYVDQATQIQAIMEATGETKEAPLVRLLVDEALAARRRKSVQSAEPELPPPTQDISETLQTLQTLMLRMIGQGESTSQMQSVSLELIQEAVVEARSGKMNVWEFLVAPGLSDKGKSTGEIAATLRRTKRRRERLRLWFGRGNQEGTRCRRLRSDQQHG